MDVDKLLTRVLTVAGGAFFAAGVALIVEPGLGSSLPFGTGMLIAVGTVAILFGLLNVRYRMRGELTETEVPNPERPAATPTPGADVDRMLYEMTELRQGILENREQLTERLEWLAVSIVRNRDGCAVDEARRIVESGEWTDNPTAAEFFRENDTSDDGSKLAGAVFRSSESEEFEATFREVVDELAELADADTRGVTDADDEPGSLLGRLLGGTDEDGDDAVVENNWNDVHSSIPSFDTDEPFEDVSLQRTNRWLGVTAFGMIAIGVGTVTTSPGLLLAGAVGIVYTVYGQLEAVPRTEALSVERKLETTDPDPGEEVEVTVTVRNEGDAFLPDLRLIDTVPDAFVVTEGTPRLHTSLRSGARASFSYTVQVERGEYQWPLLVVARDFGGTVERASLVTPEASLTCVPPLRVTHDTPVRAQTTMYAGDVSTDTGGSGLEFHSVREYRAGDPMNRINWKQVARSGDLATIDFRQERAATVTILFDTRQSAYVSESPGEPHAVDRAVHAASDVFGALFDAGNLVGVAAFDTVPCWFAPGAGGEHRERARLLFAQHPALSPRPPERQDVQGSYIDPMTHVRRRLPSNSQIFLFTPLVDDYAAEVARRLDSGGHLVTVISPDTTADRTVGQRLTRVERTVRMRYLRERGIRVVDWQPEERLDLELDKARQRWAQ